MNKHPAEIIKRPLLTEKGTEIGENENKVFFEVSLDSNKIDIREAIEALYDVKVESVNTQVMRGKIKRVGRSSGKRRNWKRAIVKLQGENTIDFFTAS